MKYKSPILSQGSGTMAGSVWSHNKGGNYVRNWRVPTNPNTAFQVAMRDYLSQLSTSWGQTLTALQRTAWATFAANVSWVDALGQSINLDGRNWYIKCNSIRLQASVAIVTAAPTVFQMATLTLPVPTITAAGTTVSVAYTNTDGWAGEVGGYLLVFASRPMNASVNFFKGPYRFAGKVSGAATPPTSPAVITLPFPSGPAGSKQFFRFVAVRADGRPSPDFRVTGTV